MSANGPHRPKVVAFKLSGRLLHARDDLNQAGLLLCRRPHRIGCHAALLITLARRNAAEGAGAANQPLDGHAAERWTARRVLRLRPAVPPRRVHILRRPDEPQTSSITAS